jgi:integrase
VVVAAPFVRTSTPGIYRRGGRYVVTYSDPSGRRRKRSAATLAEARLLKSTLAADIARGEYRELARVRFDEYARDWVHGYQGRTSRGIRPTTLEDYRRDLEGDAIPFLGSRRLGEIEPRHVKALARHLGDRGLAPATVRNVMAPVRALFATAVEEGLIRSNPCAGLRLPGSSTAADARRALTEEELAHLLDETPERWRLVVRFLAQTGLRVGELIALRWEDVDLDARRVRVRRRLYRGTVDTPKSHYGLREVPISARLAEDLGRHREASIFASDEDPVFATRTGDPLSGGNLLRRVVKPAAERAGVGWAGLHTLRHTCASMLFRAGWNAKQVQMVLGHHSPAFTLATYVHVVPADLPEPSFRHDEVAGAPAGSLPR